MILYDFKQIMDSLSDKNPEKWAELYCRSVKIGGGVTPIPSFFARCRLRLYRLIIRRAGFRVFCLTHSLLG